MSYSLSDKIAGYLAVNGIDGARVHETTIVIPLPQGGEMHRTIKGMVTTEKLDVIIEECKAKDHA